jgi:DNA repair protein RecN (Recombination protein N)
MLKHIYIRNYALIKELDLPLNNGFTTITGETGAGKSILLGALGLVLGKRAESKLVADERHKCVVEASFKISDLDLHDLFETYDLDYEPTTILRREVLPSGKSRAFINDTPVKLDVLKALGDRLIDIHSQYDSILMLNAHFQLDLVDALSASQAQKSAYTEAFNTYKALLTEKAALEQALSVNRDMDYIQFLVDEFEKSDLKAGEEEFITEELNRLRHAEEIQRNLANSIHHLTEEFGALEHLHEAWKALQEITDYMPEAGQWSERLRSAEIELKDVVAELTRQTEEVVLDENRLHQLDERFNLLQHLMQKHNVATITALIQKHEELAQQLNLAQRGSQALEAKELEIARHFEVLKEKGKLLHQARKKRAKSLEEEVGSYLTQLQLPHAQLSIDLDFRENPTASGFDDVRFLFSANPGSKPQAIHKVASGGELSRVMLALKAILAQTKSLPAIIFDEIDTGISGETAKRAAAILAEMGKQMQVIAITHLPQIAASGAQQLQVMKSIQNGQSQTYIQELAKSDRIEEIARLLSGENASDAARKTAKELLD